MDRLTRRQYLLMTGVPVLAGLGAYGAAERLLEPAPDRARYRLAGAVSARALLQQRHLPNVALVTHNGERVRFYDDLVKDKNVVVTFLSSHAPTESKTVTHNLRAVQRFFGARVGGDIFLYSIARTPRTDTPAVLRTWARRSGAGPGWRFLTGAPRTSSTCATPSASIRGTRRRTPIPPGPSGSSAMGSSARCAGRTASRWRRPA